MKKSRNHARRRALHIALIAGAAGMCFATAASADSQAAKKMGQMGVINQTLQPKPLKPANAPTNTPNVTTNPNYNANSTYNPNAANNANAANAGANAAAGGQKK
ncbi:hypothetical protein CR51_03310 [Caballeronia megalochromosomata]|nr:hypothetical protein CR51_03310 [Caballeronia megalochromosomata]